MEKDRSISRILFVLTFLTYLYFFGGGGWNQNVNFAVARAIVEDGSIRIDRFRSTTGDLSFYGGHFFANKAPGLSFLAVIPYAAIHAAERALGISPDHWRTILINAYLCTVVSCALIAAFIPPLIFLYARKHFASSRRHALAAAMVAAFGTPLFCYSTILIAHATSAALLFAAFVLSRDGNQKRLAAAGLLGGAAAITNFLCGPALAILALRAAFTSSERRLRRCVVFCFAAALPLLLLAVYQQRAFGSFTTTAIETMDPAFASKDALWLGIIKPPSLEAVWGITFSRFKGMFYVSPFLMLGLAGAIVLWKRRERYELLTIAALIGLFFTVNIMFNNWDGGFGIGARYLLPTIPFLALLASMTITPKTRAIAIALAAVSFANSFAATAVDPQPSGSFHDPLGQYIYPLLLTGRFNATVPLHPSWSPAYITGHTGVVRHTLEEYIPFMKYEPGSPQSEWASFNLGEVVFGAGQIASLLPILLLLIAGSSWLWRMAKEDARA